MRQPKPIFILSLPRAGSTLLQRVLAAHQAVTTTSEPWLLLPQLYALRPRGLYAEYGHSDFRVALSDFLGQLPGGEADYLAELREFALRLYGRAANGSAYFLDKTPRYHLVADEVLRLFPEGKFLFLWRNPLAVVASILSTWGRGRWNLYINRIDLYDGLANLLRAYTTHRGQVCAARYEDLVSRPEQEWPRIFDYLGLSYEPGLLTGFTRVRLRGQMGDHSGTDRYQEISREPLDKWKSWLNNPVRQTWCRRYLRWVGRERLALMGYDLEGLLAELAAVPTGLRGTGSDLVRMAYGGLYRALEPQLVKDKWRFGAWHAHT